MYKGCNKIGKKLLVGELISYHVYTRYRGHVNYQSCLLITPISTNQLAVHLTEYQPTNQIAIDYCMCMMG